MNRLFNNKTIILLLAIFIVAIFVISAFSAVMVKAQENSGEFEPLAPIPGVTDKETAKDTSAFFKGAFNLGITAAGFLAVIMIAIGGLQYMSTDTIYGKEAGREKITYAILGLLLILFSYILLATINPDIVSLRLFN